MEYAVEIMRLSAEEAGHQDAGRLLFRQVFEAESFDLARIVAAVNGITPRRQRAKPEAKRKAPLLRGREYEAPS